MSLTTRFRLGVAIMLLPLLNLAALAYFSLSQINESAHRLVTGPRSEWDAHLAAITAAREEALMAFAGVCVGGLLVATVVGSRLARSVLRPLMALRAAAEKLGRGELSSRVGAVRPDELGQVAVAFDAMADRLERTQSQLAHSADHDPLTGLPNRRLLLRRIGQLGADSGHWALLLVDLDDFKSVNDSFGHLVGDEVLIEMAGRLRQVVRDTDMCARLGGDEFAVLVADPAGSSGALDAAHRLREAIRRPVQVSGRSLVLDASIGVVGVGDRDAGTLLRDADLAMYAGKRAGGGRAEVFEPAMHQQALERLELEAELRLAVDRGEIRPWYQPVVELGTGRLTGLEALARWQHPTRGLVPPDVFIPLAESTDLILPIGRQILERACTEVAAWRRAHPTVDPLTLSVNLSARQLGHPDLAEDLRAALAGSGLSPAQLTLEITETVVMSDPGTAAHRMQALAAQGVHLAIDDFGTGYSSLAYLQRFPLRTLKIDRSFVDPLDTDADAVVLAGAILQLAETLGLRVIAEGVERPAHVQILERLGCRLAQGYLFGRPAPLPDLEDLIADVSMAGVAGSP
ncbi:GGDEF domain-containing response regulator [Blastococcus sp. TF02-09]|nr:GGDEF domain-containing response regulator [Blastococcus sp. TF02-9]